jgi:cullin-associated NEDD8-dissociated protein 1
MELVMDKLIDLSGKNDEEIRDIAGLGEVPGSFLKIPLISVFSALKTVTAELPHDSKLAPKTCSKLTPKLLVQLQEARVFSCVTLHRLTPSTRVKPRRRR